MERSHVPGDVVAPADGLDPVNGAGVDPHEVSRALDEAVHGDVAVVEVLQDRPPGARQVVHSVSERKTHFSGQRCRAAPFEGVVAHSLFAEVADGLPVVLVDAEPLAVSGTDVDVDGTKVVVLLVTYSRRRR